jgi:choline dehydrogenase
MFDYVIVGAGSAGCVLAARLSEEPGCRVLLLEAGPPDDAAQIRIPAVATSLWKGPFAWDDATIPQRHAAARRIHWPSGFTLGGSSSINGMIHIRGNRVDYDGWRDAYGCAGWGHADLLPYFQRAEEQLGVEHVRDPHPLTRAWVEAAKAYGLPANDDFNGPEQEGVGFYRVTQRDGGRWSAADTYLRPALRRPNLTVETGALVTAVRVEDGRAAGVRYVRAGGEHEARARREVVLSGGTVHSPQLLMLSGIGPAEHLREHGIDAIVDAPGVGRGLQDHPLAGVVWRTPDARNLSETRRPRTWRCGSASGADRWRPAPSPRAASRARARTWTPRTSSTA